MSAEGGFLGHLPSSAFAVPTICTSSQESLSEKLRFIQKCYQRTTRGRKGMGRGAGRRSRVRGRAQVAGSGPGSERGSRVRAHNEERIVARNVRFSRQNRTFRATISLQRRRQPPPCPARSPAAPDARTRHPRPARRGAHHARAPSDPARSDGARFASSYTRRALDLPRQQTARAPRLKQLPPQRHPQQASRPG